MRGRLVALLALALVVVVAGLVGQSTTRNARAAVVYAVTDLGTLPGFELGSIPTDINNSGQVVGFLNASSGDAHAFLFSDGELTDLGTLGGVSSVALGINEPAQIVGYTTGGPTRAFLYSSGVISDLGTLGGLSSQANDINELGEVVGQSATSDPTIAGHAFLFAGGIMTDLGTLPGGEACASEATAVNNSGQVAGRSCISSDRGPHAFLLTDGIMADLGTLGGDVSLATGINNLGQVVGLAYRADEAQHAFLSSRGKMTDLGSVGDFRDSFALDINNSGQIVGVLRSPSTSPQNHGFLYNAGRMIDLNTVPLSDPDWVLIEATAVNDRGQIVGWGLHNGQRRGFLLTATGDTDGDGCDDLRENGSSGQQGGQRNYLNFWDFYDVWSRAGASAPWVREEAANDGESCTD